MPIHKSIESVPPAQTPTDAVAIAERYADCCGDRDAFIDLARTAYLYGHDGSDIPHDALDDIEERAGETWERLNPAPA